MNESQRLAVVTGANGDQGRAVVSRYVKDGFRVLAVDLRFDRDFGAGSEGSDGVVLVETDISSRASIAVVEGRVEHHGRCDVLYNNAGIYLASRGDGDASEVELGAWDNTIAVNVTGALHMIKAVLPSMLRNSSGLVINVASLAGVLGSRNIAYTASKAALIGLTKSLAFTHGARGIRSVAMSLGPVNTRMMEDAKSAPDTWDRILSSVPVGRAAEPSEIAAWASFLASDGAAYANGANLVIDGGRGVGI